MRPSSSESENALIILINKTLTEQDISSIQSASSENKLVKLQFETSVNQETYDTSQVLKEIAEQVPNLQKLELVNVELDNVKWNGAKFNNLKSLSLTNTKLSVKRLPGIIAQFPDLEKLDLTGCSELKSSDLPSILEASKTSKVKEFIVPFDIKKPKLLTRLMQAGQRLFTAQLKTEQQEEEEWVGLVPATRPTGFVACRFGGGQSSQKYHHLT